MKLLNKDDNYINAEYIFCGEIIKIPLEHTTIPPETTCRKGIIL